MSPAPDVWPSILTDYTYDSELDNADGVPHSVSSGNQGYIRNLGRFQLLLEDWQGSIIPDRGGTSQEW